MKQDIQFNAILGPAGSGKSYYINQLIEQDPTCLYRTATTGAAALLGSGRTINSSLGFFEIKDLIKKVDSGEINKNLKYIAKTHKGICIDEISMLDALKLDLIVQALDKYNSDISNKPLNLTLVGDFIQLPNVVTGKETYKVLPAFESLSWSRFDITKLSTIHRQSNQEFIKLLEDIRKGESKACADWLETNGNFHNTIDPNVDGITIFSRNNDVHNYNYDKLKALKGKFVKYQCYTQGTPPPLSSKIPKELFLKPNCKVIIMVNNLKEGYANGSIGRVTKFAKDSVKVLLKNGNEVDIEYKTIPNETPTGITGYFSYLPLRPAYASTVHGCQGLTIDSILQCKLGDSFLSTLHGGIYVIMSRVVKPELLKFVGSKEQFIRCNYIDPNYLKWA